MRTAVREAFYARGLGRWAHEFKEGQSGDVRVLSLSGRQSVSPSHIGGVNTYSSRTVYVTQKPHCQYMYCC